VLTVEKATRDDAPAVWQIRNAAIRHQCPGHYPADVLELWTAGQLSEDFADAVERDFYVARDDGQVVATGKINIETGKIDAVFVHPDHMRKGIGKRIVHFLESIAVSRGLERLTLESTLNAAAFYRACGFTGIEVSTYLSPRGISLACIPMAKVIAGNNRSGKDAV
jgi:N-acetylglutamate synthase-like GNAT family acetyltransferase